jgi:hypothetical protein
VHPSQSESDVATVHGRRSEIGARWSPGGRGFNEFQLPAKIIGYDTPFPSPLSACSRIFGGEIS